MNMVNRPVAPPSILKMQAAQESQTGNKQGEESNALMAASFEQSLAKALEPVNNLQLEAADLDAKLATGNLEYVHQAMVVGEKASLALNLTVQIRNKIIEAYQEIMRTQV